MEKLIEELRINAGAHQLELDRVVMTKAAVALESQEREIERLKAGQASLILVRDDYKRQANEYRDLWSRAVVKAQPDPWQASGANWCSSIHRNPDAKAWADFFVAVFPGQADKHELMIGWFANAMMAMHDHLKAQPSGVVLPPHANTGAAIQGILQAIGIDGDVSYHLAGQVWNACLDEVARLNQPASGGDDAERAAFEAWFIEETKIKYVNSVKLDRDKKGNYLFCTAYDYWRVWQARALPVREAVAEGWQLVPVEPTQEMITAAEDAYMPFGDMDIALRCALLAAPSPSREGE